MFDASVCVCVCEHVFVCKFKTTGFGYYGGQKYFVQNFVILVKIFKNIYVNYIKKNIHKNF